MTGKVAKSPVTRTESLAAHMAGSSATPLTEFIADITAYADAEPLFKCYRGQRNGAWKNIPALFRPDLAKLAQNEKRAVRDLVSVHPNEFVGDETMFDRLVRMQHFGLPTRLMDVSQNLDRMMRGATGQ
jgi:hypothetical protein